MKQVLILALLLIRISFCQAQYTKDKLIDILTDGNTKTWSVKNSNANRPEKTFTFKKDMSVTIQKDNAKGGFVTDSPKWIITTKDNIRWFIEIGNQSYEIVVSYDKKGSRFVKLTHQAGVGKATGSFEIILIPA